MLIKGKKAHAYKRQVREIVLSPRPLSSSSFTGAILTQSQQGFHILERID